MPKYKKVNEDIIDTLLGGIFSAIGKRAHSVALKTLSKRDPELGDKIKKLEKLRGDLEKSLKSKGVPGLTKTQKRALARGELI
jgi:hypothetical protein|tara:strand:- start:1006 stop:1254 length:249 start_codon:yes stop_codon:yes gene_type:complete